VLDHPPQQGARRETRCRNESNKGQRLKYMGSQPGRDYTKKFCPKTDIRPNSVTPGNTWGEQGTKKIQNKSWRGNQKKRRYSRGENAQRFSKQSTPSKNGMLEKETYLGVSSTDLNGEKGGVKNSG